MRRTLAVAAMLSALAGALHGADLSLRFVPPQGVATGPTAGVVVLQRMDGVDHPIVKHPLREGVVIALPAGTWEIHYEDAAWWHERQSVTVPDAGAEALLRVRPTGQLSFRVSAEDGRPRKSIVVSLRETEAGGRSTRIEVTCPLEKEQGLCVVPSGTFDLEAGVTAALSQFLPDQTIVPGKTTKVSLAIFRDGAALHGWVTFAHGVTQPNDPIRVTLTQISEGRLQTPGLTKSATADKKGFFRFADIPPGRYEIAAATSGLASERIIERARASTETALVPDLVLQAQHVIRVRVTPEVDPDGQPWRVKVGRAGIARNAGAGDGLVNDKGAWSSSPVPSGSYSVSVGRTDGSSWENRVIQLADADLTVDVSVAAIRIRGDISLRGKPVAGRLTFGTPHGAVETAVDVSTTGTFESYVPRQDAYDLFFETEHPTVSHRFLHVAPREDEAGDWRLTLTLPATTLDGLVVDESGTPVKDAEVVAAPPTGSRERPPSASTDVDGSFELVGLDPGRYVVTATGPGGRSAPTEATLTNDDMLSLRLVLVKDAVISGRVLSSALAPVTGARVVGYPIGLPMPAVGVQITDTQGAFQCPMPAGTKEVDLLVMPMGYGLVIGRFPVGDAPLVITTSSATGTLTLDVPSRDGLPISIFLVHDGASALVASVLNAWPTRRIETAADRLEITVESAEPGTYTVCYGKLGPQMTRPMIPSACSPAGYLAPFGQLRLSVPKFERER